MSKTYRQLEDKAVYEQVPDDPSFLVNTLIKVLEKILLRGYLLKDALDYILVKDPNFLRFFLLIKIHKQLNDVSGIPVILNCS